MDDEYEILLNKSISNLSDDDALKHIADFIDYLSDNADIIQSKLDKSIKHAIFLIDELKKRKLNPILEIRLYYIQNNIYNLTIVKGDFGWNSEILSQRMLLLSSARNHKNFGSIDPHEKCQILVNLANIYLDMGRLIDAIEILDDALKIIPEFAIANGNKAFLTAGYLQWFLCTKHLEHSSKKHAIFLVDIHSYASHALEKNAIWDGPYPPNVRNSFAKTLKSVDDICDIDEFREKLSSDLTPSLGDCSEERDYRSWCLENRLFLNVLNDIVVSADAASDDLLLPDIIWPLKDGVPDIIKSFNQIKQEYVAIRYILYEGLNSEGVHFSDKNVDLVNTLDSPSYSLATEKIRISGRIAYSLFDKIAFFINYYWGIGKKNASISFRTVWYDNKQKLSPKFLESQNLPLRGLFGISEEFFSNSLKNKMRPDTCNLSDLRNFMEHRFVQVSDNWVDAAAEISQINRDDFEQKISLRDLKIKTLRIMKLARSAICYLSAAVGFEEKKKANALNGEKLLLPMELDNFEDDRKQIE